jgi:formylglycine-generating enzyme required for sulfatase activity
MPLTGRQIKQIQELLLDAFPSKTHLEMMVRFELDKSLDAIAEAGDQTLRVYKLIAWAERTGNVQSLIAGANAQMPTNPAIAKLARDSREWALDTPASPVPQPETRPHSAGPVVRKGLDEIQATYLDYLYTRYQHLDFKGMGMLDRVSLRLPLTHMYVPLKARIEVPEGETWAHELRLAGRRVSKEEVLSIGERLSLPLPVLELLTQYNGLVILGDPGAGKTTFAKYLAVMLALGKGEELGLADRLPVMVPLSAYANTLAQGDISLQAFLGEYYRNRGIDLQVERLFEAALAAGNALVMLDGLDEVQALANRALVVERVEAFFDFHHKQGNKFIITSRIVGYRAARLSAVGLRECTLVDFDDDDIALFVEKWTQALEQAAQGESAMAALDAAEEKAEILYAMQRNPGVRQLASNPLLLTILALMKRQGVLLPERRVQLYDQYVHTLLRHWNLTRGLDRRASRDLDVLETLRVLAPLALWMHETSPGTGLVKYGAMRRRLMEIYAERGATDPEKAAEQLLFDARVHASLLLERGAGEYGFIHLTFQEYLAAIAIAQHGQSTLSPVVVMLNAHVEDAQWREVALLTIGYMGIIQQRDEAAGEVLMQLMQGYAGTAGAAVVLAGEAVLDTWPGGVTQQCRKRVEEALLQTMTDDVHGLPRLRARAGSVLSALGDPGNFDEMVLVPAGPFRMGSNEDKDEQPEHEVYVDAFRIAKYPVTNGQYAQFVQATGHRSPDHWRNKTPPPELCNHPVVYVTWYDAMAYCAWLSEVRGEKVRLPTEAEWEKAARGIDGRRYPWGEEPDPNRANYSDTGIRTTSAVGSFPGGVSHYGCLDMAGNVWEWTSSKYQDYPYDADDGREDLEDDAVRTLRGGSWSGAEYRVRCAYRYGYLQLNGYGYHGFRVVSSPGS